MMHKKILNQHFACNLWRMYFAMNGFQYAAMNSCMYFNIGVVQPRVQKYIQYN